MNRKTSKSFFFLLPLWGAFLEEPAPQSPAFQLAKARENPAGQLHGRTVKVGEILDYIQSRYAPQLGKELDSAYGAVQLESSDFDRWVDDYLDLQLLAPLAAQRSVLVEREEVEKAARKKTEEMKKKLVADRKLDEASAEAASAGLLQRTLRNQGLSLERGLLLEKLLAKPFSPTELRAHFVSNPARFGGSVRVSQILLSTVNLGNGKRLPRAGREIVLQEANALVAKLREKADFAELAKVNSDDEKSKSKGGDLGYIKRRSAVAEALTRAAFAASPGEIVGPIETEQGYHILRIVDRKLAQQPDFNAVRGEVEDDYFREKAALLLESLRDEAKCSAE